MAATPTTALPSLPSLVDGFPEDCPRARVRFALCGAIGWLGAEARLREALGRRSCPALEQLVEELQEARELVSASPSELS